MRSAGRYALALALTLATLVLRWALNPIIGTGTLYITLFPAMVVVAVTSGVGPGLLGNAVGIVLFERFLADPSGHVAPTVSLGVRSGLMLLTTYYVGRVGERLRAARALAVGEGERLRTTLTSIGDAVIVTDDLGRVTLLNDVAATLTGWRREDAIGEPVYAVLRPDGAPRALEEAPPFRALRGEYLDGVEEVVRTRATGELRHHAVTAAPIKDAAGRISGSVSVVRDITDLKRALEAAERSRTGLGRLADATLRVVRETDLEGMLQAISEAALALTGARLAACGHGEIQGHALVGGHARVPEAPACPPGEMFAFVRGGVHMDLVEGADAIRLTDEQLRAHPRFWGGPAGHVPLRGLLGARMVGRNGMTSGLLLVTDKAQGEFTDEDESLLRQLATVTSLALQHVEARISLEASDRSKNDFLAMLSHELRNPLAPIRNSLFVLNRAAAGGEQAKRAQGVIDRQVLHLTRLVDELLDVTRISLGKIHLQPEHVDLGDLVRRAVEDHRAVFDQYGLHLETELPQRPLWVHGDRTRLVQVVGNLLNNAAKFTEPGGRISVSLTSTHDPRRAVVRVRDTGVGIGPDLLPRIFEPFAQADTTLARSKGGLGLGLSLVKGLVEMHGGSVTVESEGPGHGAEFVVRLPVDGEAPRPAPARARAEARPRSILVIEDHVDSANSLREVLELHGHAVAVAYSSTDGLAAARRQPPDVVLCDIGLPGMDGYQVAQAMKADPRLARTKLVALTGYAALEDVARSKTAGFDAHVAKPLDLDALEGVLAGFEGAAKTSPDVPGKR